MLFQTYFKNVEKMREEYHAAKFIAVCRERTQWVNPDIVCDEWEKNLAPSGELLRDWKAHNINWDEYVQRFLAEMEKPKAQEVMLTIAKEAQTHDVFLVCYEGPGKHCHRYLLLDLIMKLAVQNNIEIEVCSAVKPNRKDMDLFSFLSIS